MSERKFVTMREIGGIYGATSHEVGKWLTDLGYRKDGYPTKSAQNENLTTSIPNPKDPDFFVHGWDHERVIEMFKMMGYRSKKMR